MSYARLLIMTQLQNPKLIGSNKSLEHANSIRAKNKSIVFTNGCFDILHAGHAYYLAAAKAHGDYLWIGLNSDSSVSTLKGTSRPIHDQEARAFLLSNLECVDYITIFDDETPISLLSQIQPNSHIKGGDYTKEELPEYPVVKEYGGEVIIKPFLPGYSTTAILAKLQSS